MSRENVKRFYELAETDKVLAQKLAILDSEMSLEASDLANLKAIVNEKIIPLAKEKGLDFTAEEMVEFANEKYMQLSEDDLLEVSGGVSPKAAGLTLSSVLLLSLGSAAAINLMNSNHDDVSQVVSAPSKTASEEKDESEDEEEELQKNLDEMLKKSPKGADKNANMEDIEKELDKLFKGGKLGGGSAFKPGKGRAAGKNMLNRTIGKKGTSDFDKFLKELEGELAKEAATSQAAKPKAATSEVSNFDLDKFMEEINREKKSETGAARAATSDTTPIEEEAKPAPTATSARIEETGKPAPISKGTSEKGKGAVGEDASKSTLISQGTPKQIEKTKDPNETLHKMQYESVSRGITTPWKDIMSHVMGALQKAKYDLSYFDEISLQKLQNDIDWICGEMKASDGTYYLGASALLGGAIRSKYGWNTTKPTLENKELEFLQALKDSRYNQDDTKVQTALKALKIKEGPVKKHDASGEDQARREREEAEEKARLQVLANRKADDFKEALIKDFKGIAPTKVDDDALRFYAESYLNKHGNEKDMYYVSMNVVFYATGSSGITEDSSFDVLEVLREANNALPEKNSQFVFESQEAAQQTADELASAFKLTVERAFNFNFNYVETQLSDEELQQFVNEITSEAKAMQEIAIVEGNLVKFFAKGQLKDGTPVVASQPVNVFELAKELNSRLPSAVEEQKDETVKIQDEIKEKVVEKPNAGATTTTAKELQKQAEEQKQDAETKLTDTFKDKIAANNGLELNEANLNKLISDALNSYEGKENITVNEKKGTITFTAKGTIPGTVWGTKAGVGSVTLNVREFFTKLNDKATEARRASEREKFKHTFKHTKYIPATDNDVIGGVELARKTAKKMIQEKFNKIIVEKYNAKKPAKKATSVVDIPAVKRATIVKSLDLEDVVASIVKSPIDKVDGFKIKGTKELKGQFSIKIAPENKELKIGAIGYKKTGLFGTSTELIKYGDEISIRRVVQEHIESYTVNYKTVVGQNADKEAEALYKFLTDNKLVENGTVVESVLDTIKYSDKEQFEKDVKHIAGNISGGDGSYTLSGKWRNYNVAQEKLKAIKDLAKQLGD